MRRIILASALAAATLAVSVMPETADARGRNGGSISGNRQTVVTRDHRTSAPANRQIVVTRDHRGGASSGPKVTPSPRGTRPSKSWKRCSSHSAGPSGGLCRNHRK